MKGRGVIFLVDGMTLSRRRAAGCRRWRTSPRSARSTRPASTSCSRSTASRSARTSCSTARTSRAPVDVGGRKMLKNLPVFVGVKTDQTDKDNSILAGVNVDRLPVPQLGRAGRPAGGRQDADARRQALDAGRDRRPRPGSRPASSSSRRWPPIEEAKDPKDHGVFGLAYAYQGTLKSAYPAARRGARDVGVRTTCRRPSRASRSG